MKTAHLMIAVASIAIGVSAFNGATVFAQDQGAKDQDTSGMITGINRLNGTVGIATLPSGTVGSSAVVPGAAEQFKVKDEALLDNVHAGDRITYTATETGGVKTITKLDRQK